MRLALLLLLGGCASGCATGSAQRAAMGELLLRVRPAEARVLLDDRDIGTGEMLQGRVLRLHPGLRRVEFEAEGRYAARRETNIIANQRTELTIDLPAIPDGMKD